MVRAEMTAHVVPLWSSEIAAQETKVDARAPIFTSHELLGGRREAWIEHGDQMYRLRLTHAGKLYLTK